MHETRFRPSVLTVVAALVLIAVPTGFGLFPEWGYWPATARIIIALAWLLVASYVVVGTTRTEERMKALMDQKAEDLAALSELSYERILSALVGSPERSLPGNYEVTVYLYDEEARVLLPSYPSPAEDATDLRAFASGKGATGTAWDRGDLVLVTDDAVSDDSYGLTPDQQDYFRGFAAVVATPILEPSSRSAVGVLAAISRVNDGYFEADESKKELQLLADVIGFVITRI